MVATYCSGRVREKWQLVQNTLKSILEDAIQKQFHLVLRRQQQQVNFRNITI